MGLTMIRKMIAVTTLEQSKNPIKLKKSAGTTIPI